MTSAPDTAGSPRLHRGWIVGLVILVVGFIAIAVDTALHFQDSPLDGPFQLFNGLRRIADGQLLGGHFQVFHGPGVPYLHYPLFWLFGGDFLASELSRQIVSVGAAMAVLLAFFRVWVGSWRASVPLSVVALCTLIPLRVNALLFPINSMIGLRSTIPIFIGIHLLLRPAGRRAMAERAALFAMALMFGIEQGMAAIAAFAALTILMAIRRRDWRELVRGFGTIAGAIAIYAALVFLMTPSGFSSVMRFNFREVPADQMWYFGGPPNHFFFSWMHLFIAFEHPIWSAMILVVVVGTIYRYWKDPAAPDAAMRVAEAFLGIYAVASMASMLGTFNTVYMQPATRVALFIAIIGIRRWWLDRRDTLNISDSLRRRAPAYATFALVGYAAVGWVRASIAVVRTPIHIAYAHVYLGDKAEMWPDWQMTIAVGDTLIANEQRRLGRKPTLWSTYASYLEYEHEIFPPGPDYIIHALGHDRRVEYARLFEATKPDIVQTLDPTYTRYEEWLTLHHWNFYRPLLRDYQLAAIGPWSYFWVRRPQPYNERPRVIVHSKIPPGMLGLALDGNSVPVDSLGFFEVRLFYRVENPLRAVPVLNTLPRYLVHVGGAANHLPVSLPPYETEKRFPVIAVGRKDIKLLGEVVSIVPGSKLIFDSIHVERLHLAPDSYRWARDWILGARRDSTGATK